MKISRYPTEMDCALCVHSTSNSNSFDNDIAKDGRRFRPVLAKFWPENRFRCQFLAARTLAFSRADILPSIERYFFAEGGLSSTSCGRKVPALQSQKMISGWSEKNLALSPRCKTLASVEKTWGIFFHICYATLERAKRCPRPKRRKWSWFKWCVILAVAAEKLTFKKNMHAFKEDACRWYLTPN